jgi:hypothetical protein
MKRFVLSLAALTLFAFVSCSQSVRRNPGGHSDTGGTNETGGSNDTGGSSETGGTSDSGGSSETGGASDSGGSSETGGTSDTGGSSETGGSAGSGGSNPSGGSSQAGGSAGSSNTCGASPDSNAVAFCKGQAVGAMTGWGWVALGSADTLTDPTCDTAKAAITSAAPCTANTNWNKTDALCMSGSIPALAGEEPDYAGNWGIQLGVNAKDPNEGMGTSWKTVTLSVSGSPTTGLRAILHKSGDADDVGYCAGMKSGTALAITDFNSMCWDSSGDDLTEGDAGSIDKVGVQVTPSTEEDITVSDLCLTKVEFGN